MDRFSLRMLVLIIAIPFFYLMAFLTRTFGIDGRAALPAFSLGQVSFLVAQGCHDILEWSWEKTLLRIGSFIAVLSLILAIVRLREGTLDLRVVGGWIFGLIIGAAITYAAFSLYHKTKRPNH